VNLAGVAELATAMGGGGLVMGLIDRWRYRGRPRLDVAELAQRIAAETLQHASAEIDRAWAAADRYRQQLDAVRAEYEQQIAGLRAEYEQQVEKLRAEIRELRSRVDILGEEKAALVTQLQNSSPPL
jgi:hypothetical protein